MTQSTTVAEQITDSITQTAVGTIGVAPAQATATLYQTSAAAVSMSLQNAVHHQNNHSALSRAVAAQAIQALLSAGATGARQAAPAGAAVSALERKLSELEAALSSDAGPPAK